MNCQKASQLDLAAFIDDPRALEWEEFRDHYPRCADCAREVREWREVHLLLEAANPERAHPAEEALLRFERSPDALPAVERESLRRHLAACRSCADELAALRVFHESRAAVARGRHEGAGFHRRRWRPAIVLPELFRRVVLHPVFAYALVLVLLYPAVVERRLGIPRADDVRRHEELGGSRGGEEVGEPLRQRSLGGSRGGELVRGPSWSVLTLRASERAEVPATALGAGLVLRVPLRRPGEVEVHVLDAEGLREIRERFRSASEAVGLRVPASWLSPGAYRAELYEVRDASASRVPGGPPAKMVPPEPEEVFRFEVSGRP